MCRRLARVRLHLPAMVLATGAAGLAYLIAGWFFGAEQAFFAPIAAVVATGLSAGRRRRRAVEITVGVVCGLSAADLLVRVVGAGTWQLMLSVLVATSAAVAFRASTLVVNQAAVAAVVVVALIPVQQVGPWTRLGDAIVGGCVAVVLTAVAAPDPYRAASRSVDDLLRWFIDVLVRTTEALDNNERVQAESALAEMDHPPYGREQLIDAIEATREKIRWRRTARPELVARLGAVEQVSTRWELLLSSARALCRATSNLVRHAEPVDASLVTASRSLVDSLELLRQWTQGRCSAEEVRSAALRAAALASRTDAIRSQAAFVFTGQLRSLVIDVLRVTGSSQESAVALLEKRAGRADRLGLSDNSEPFD